MRADHPVDSPSSIFPRLLGLILVACILSFALHPEAAKADAWLPLAGNGDVEPMVRYSYADQQFPSNSFSSATRPGSSEHETQIRITGEHGFGNGFSLDYDLRYGFLYRSKVKKGVKIVDTNNGLQEQRVGLNYALAQDISFADAIGLSVIGPGSSVTKIPGLDNGRWAAEPDYHLGFKPGFWKLTTNLDMGTRIFLDGGAAQFRTELEVRAPVVPGLHLAGKVFFVRSARLSAYNNARDRGELYNLLRVGVEAAYHLTDSIEPVVAYEDYLAGMGGHAAQRFTIGVKISY